MTLAAHSKQQGFLLITVVVILAVLAAVAILLSTSASMDNATLAKHAEVAELDYVTEAGMAHAKWRLAQNTSCTNFTDIPATTFGAHSYSTTVTPSSSSPVTLSATGMLTDGTSRTLSRTDVKAYQPRTTVLLQPDAAAGKDTYVYEWQKARNFGAAVDIRVENRYANSWSNGLLKFDLTAIPAAAKIVSATLGLYQNATAAGGGDFSIHRVTNSWVEGTMTGNNGSPNWTDRNVGVAWTVAGGDYDLAPAATVNIPAGLGTQQWEIGELVQKWVAGATPNLGLAIVPASFGSNAFFSSSDATTATNRPKLTITFACECDATCASGPLGGNLLLVVGNAGTLATQDSAKKTLIESWGHTVQLIDDNASQAEFDAAAAANSVAYVSATVFDTTLGTKLVGSSIGVVSEKATLVDEFGFSTNRTGSNQTTVSITDNSHYITSVFSLGVLTLHSSPQPSFTLSGTLAGGLESLADGNGGEPGLAVLEQGASLAGGGTAAGKRVKLPWGGAAFDHSLMNANGETIMRRAIEWGASSPLVSKNLLFVVANVSSPTPGETSRQTLIESWGYTVALIDDSDSQTNLNTAAATNDVVYVSEDIDHTQLQDKLRNSATGLVNEEQYLYQEFGFSGSRTQKPASQIDIVDNSHYITSDFPIGLLTFNNTDQMSSMVVNTAAGVQTLGMLNNVGPNWDPGLVVIETGGEMYGGGPAPARRVKLPFQTISALNANGQTMMRRAIEWAAGASGTVAGPVAHWKMDETSGTAAADSIGGHDGTLLNGPIWTPGAVNGGLSFDGTNDYIRVPNDASLLFTEGMSFVAWTNTSTTGSGYKAILAKDVPGNGASNYWFGIQNDELVFGFWASGSFRTVKTTTANLASGTWYHVAATFDNATDVVRLFVDGAESHVGSITYEPTTESADLWIGHSPDGEYWDGKLDDVRVYDEVLAESVIAGLAGSGGGGGGGGSPGVLGFDTEFGSIQSNVRRLQIATQVTLPEDGTVASITAYVGGRDRNVRYAIYSDVAGEPGALQVESANVLSQTSMSWVNADVPATALAAGTYWLALSFDDDLQQYTYQSGGQTRYSNNRATLIGFTSNWGSSTASYAREISIYATYTP